MLTDLHIELQERVSSFTKGIKRSKQILKGFLSKERPLLGPRLLPSLGQFRFRSFAGDLTVIPRDIVSNQELTCTVGAQMTTSFSLRLKIHLLYFIYHTIL